MFESLYPFKNASKDIWILKGIEPSSPRTKSDGKENDFVSVYGSIKIFSRYFISFYFLQRSNLYSQRVITYLHLGNIIHWLSMCLTSYSIYLKYFLSKTNKYFTYNRKYRRNFHSSKQFYIISIKHFFLFCFKFI